MRAIPEHLRGVFTTRYKSTFTFTFTPTFGLESYFSIFDRDAAAAAASTNTDTVIATH